MDEEEIAAGTQILGAALRIAACLVAAALAVAVVWIGRHV
jgi:hypothetical protein